MRMGGVRVLLGSMGWCGFLGVVVGDSFDGWFGVLCDGVLSFMVVVEEFWDVWGCFCELWVFCG